MEIARSKDPGREGEEWRGGERKGERRGEGGEGRERKRVRTKEGKGRGG